MVDELLIGLLGTIITIIASIATLAYWLGKKFTEIDYRFKEIDNKFEGVYHELKDIRAGINRLTEGFTGYQEFFIELLTSEGILKAEKAVLARNELIRITKLISTNPFTKEEVKRLEELLMKDELTLEEALELRELARKVVREYGEYPEAWKLHAYASIMVGLALRRQMEKEQREKDKEKQG